MYVYIASVCNRRHYTRATSLPSDDVRYAVLVLSAEGAERIDRSLRLHETRPPRTTHSRERDDASLLPRVEL